MDCVERLFSPLLPAEKRSGRRSASLKQSILHNEVRHAERYM